MDFETFERRVVEVWEAIPDRFKEGVSAFVVDPGRFAREEFEEGWCYGYCEPDPVVSLIPDAPVCSRITVFHGSFVEIARLAQEGGAPFDWEEEIVETVRHELQHHLEWRAGEDGLGDEDDLQDDNERRLTGLPFTPGFHRWGAALGDGAWLGDDTLFVEVGLRPRAWRALARAPLEHVWQGIALQADQPVPSEWLKEGGTLYLPAYVVDAEHAWSLPWRDVALVVWRRSAWGWW